MIAPWFVARGMMAAIALAMPSLIAEASAEKVVSRPEAVCDEREGCEDAEAEIAQRPASLAALHETQDDCESFDEIAGPDSYIQAALGDERNLHLVLCYAGAYNFAYAAYDEERGRFERVWFADYSAETSWTATNVIVNPAWDASSGVLSMFNRGRGLGDCGRVAEWRNHGGTLRLERFHYKEDCDGEGEAGAFPLVFEAPALTR